MVIQRITLFKVVDEANIQPMLDAYKTVAETNQKVVRTDSSRNSYPLISFEYQDGKPYILEVKARRSLSGDRGKGYTFVAMTRFKNMEDVKYYDEECEAHKKLKAFGQDKVEQPWQPPLTVFFED